MCEKCKDTGKINAVLNGKEAYLICDCAAGKGILKLIEEKLACADVACPNCGSKNVKPLLVKIDEK